MATKKQRWIFFPVLVLLVTGALLFRKENTVLPQLNFSLLSNSAIQPADLTVDEKIGQLLIINFNNNYLDKKTQELIEKYHIGGVNILRNIATEQQATDLISKLNSASKIPLFIAIDQEGGTVVRFRFLKELTSQNKINDTKRAYEVALNRAQELKRVGVNMNFSPVIDNVSNSNSYLYQRTFRAPPGIAGELGEAMVDGYIKGGIIPVIKHFPSYGNTADPHKNKVVLKITQEELQSSLLPFKNIIANRDSIAVMTAHIIIPAVSQKPATVSNVFINQILRKDLKYNGVSISDDLAMLSAGGSIGRTAVEAIKAGVDIVIVGGQGAEAFNAIKKAVDSGEISQERLDESVSRVLELKRNL